MTPDENLNHPIPCATCGLPARPQWLTINGYDSRTRISTHDETVMFYLCQKDHLTGRDGNVYEGTSSTPSRIAIMHLHDGSTQAYALPAYPAPATLEGNTIAGPNETLVWMFYLRLGQDSDGRVFHYEIGKG